MFNKFDNLTLDIDSSVMFFKRTKPQKKFICDI